MLNSRQRAQLRGMANSYETIFQIGKGGIGDQLIKQVDEALEARELIKLRVLETAGITSRIAADEIAPKVGADVVQVIGTKFILYRAASQKENRKIVLVK
ncbi:MAG: YhbY family RNA-binding protein [Clostridia bacterium]|nr:YhbY family RNA-binding protein [Clostridia bacterium]